VIKLKHFLLEQNLSGKTLISVDIQPEYIKSFSFRPYQFTNWLNKSYIELNQIIFLYNGADTLGMISEQNYKYWLLENELSEEVVDGSIFYDKGYAFFRHCLDSGLNDDITVNFVRFMYENDITDSRDFTRDMWAKYLRLHRKTDKKEAYELLKQSGDCVNIPDLMEFLKKYNNLILCGGGKNECLKEVEIALKALNKPYQTYNDFIY